MIEATCAACGTVNRIAEADVPAGTKFVTCTSCKSRVALPIAKTMMQGGAGLRPPGPPIKVPSIPAPAPAAKRDDAINISDLPAPKRQSPLAGAEPASKPAPRSALAEADLPAPKPMSRPAPTGAAIDLDDLLPAAPPAKSGPTASPAGLADLPAPKAKGPARPKLDMGDLPAPVSAKSKLDPGDLPAPVSKPKTPPAGVPVGKPPAPGIIDLGDLPAPAKKKAEVSDLLAPKGTRQGVADLPAPKAKLAPPAQPAGPVPTLDELDLDLPMPPPDVSDLPTPKPGANNDLPAPKGFFEDLPQPAKGGGKGASDLPAPKGFFEDLPQPAKGGGKGATDLPAPKGFFDDLPQPAKQQDKSGLPAPKGFFDDLPQPAKQQDKSGLPAPKGFFDDLPQSAPASSQAGSKAASTAGNAAGLFDDLETPPKAGIFDDLAPAGAPSRAGDLELGEDLDAPALDLDDAPELDLGGPPPKAAAAPATPVESGAGQFDDLDLSSPTVSPPPEKAAGGIRITTPAAAKAKQLEAKPMPAVAVAKTKDDIRLDLEDDPHKGIGAPAAVAAKRKQPPKNEASPELAAKKKKKQRVVLASVLALALAGAGGAYVYKKHAAAEARAEEIQNQLQTARTAMSAGDPKHWQRAAAAAKAVLELDDKEPAALGLASEALIAGAIDDGVNGAQRIKEGRKLIQDALAAGVNGPELERAQAIAALAANQADRAVLKLQALAQRAPKDGFLQLYVGWAQLAKSDAEGALKAFDAAVAASPNVKIPALYGHGRAKLLLADLDGARTDFTAVLQADKNYVPAMVDLAATLPPSQTQQKESDLLAILERKDIATADPRAVIRAWTLAADLARVGGRLDVARERYHSALKITANDPAALTGLADVEMRDGKLEVAQDLLQKALAASPDYVDAQVEIGELLVRQGKLDEAIALIKKLAAHDPPLPPLQAARLALVKGHLLALQGKEDDAVESYVEGAKLAGELDLEPTMAAVTKLADLSKKATDAKNDAKAAEYHQRAEELLSSLAGRAQDDPNLAMTLGVAYLQAGDAGKAEGFLRRTVEMRGQDVEAKLALAKALSRLGRTTDAIAQLDAAHTQDPSRNDIALELARTLEAAGRDADAAAAYDKLLANPDVPMLARVYAGRYFASHGNVAKAAAQAQPILAAEPDSAAGHYLKGEGLLAANKLDEARKELQLAVDGDPDPQYLDAQGRAAEASAAGDSKYQDLALRAYERATTAAPNMINPLVGSGRLYVARGEYSKAIAPLEKALSVDPNNAAAMYLLGVCAQSLNQKPSAIAWLEKAYAKKQEPETAWRLGQLYEDTNQPQKMVGALNTATRMAAEQEKQTGTPVPWLTDAYYKLGFINYTLQNRDGARDAWEKYVGRNPKPGSQLSDVKYRLSTELKKN